MTQYKRTWTIFADAISVKYYLFLHCNKQVMKVEIPFTLYQQLCDMEIPEDLKKVLDEIMEDEDDK